MTKEAHLEDGTVLEFPDDTPDAVMDRTVRQHVTGMAPKQPQQKPSFMDVVTSPDLAGGPLAMIGRKGVEQVNKFMDALAYGAGSKTTDVLAGNVPPEFAAGAGYLANVGTNLGASFLIGKMGAAAGKPVMQAASRRTMQAALKPGIRELESGKATRAIETLLKEDVGVNQGGVARLRAEISKLEDEIEAAIKGSGAMINKGKVGLRLKDALDKFKMQVNPDADTEAIRKAWVQFRNHPLLAGKTDIPIDLAQNLKRGTYRALDDKAFGELQGASEEAQKALARGLKEEIAAAVPAVGPLNARQGDLLNAAKLAQRRALIASNNNVLGLSPIAPNVGSMLAFLADRSPTAASYLARLMYQNAGVIPGGIAVTGATPMLMQGAYPPALSSE